MRRRRVRWALGGACFSVVALVVLALAPSSGAQSSASLFIRAIDTVDPANATIDYVATGSDGRSPQITVNNQGISPKQVGNYLDAPQAAQVGLALVVDTGPNMSDTNALVDFKAAARDWVRKAADKDVQISIYQAGDRPNLVQSFTSDVPKLEAAIDRLTPSSQSAIWSTLQQAAGSFGENNSMQPNIILAVGNSDQVNPADQPAARGAVLGTGAAFFPIEFTGRGLDPAPYDSLVAQTGGISRASTDAGRMGPMMTETGNTLLDNQYRAGVDMGLQVGQVADVAVTVGGQTSRASVVMGGSAQGNQQLNPQVVGGGGPLGFLSNGFGLVIGLVLVLAAIAFFVYALVLLFVPDDSLSNVLQPYDGFTADEDFDDDSSAIAKSALLQRAVELTEQVAESQGYLSRAEAALERANLPLRAGEALFFYLGVVLVATLLFLFLSRSFIVGLIAGVVVAMIPPAVVNFLAARRRRTFMEQLPDTLQLLSGTLRAGYSLMQGVEAVAQEVDDPMGTELRRVVTESRLGRPLEESLDASAERMDSPDFAWAVMAIRIQREVGGNLSELLLTVAETMTARERLRRDVRTLTAEGRMSAIILGILPIGLGAVMFVVNPVYMGQLFKTTLGLIMLVTALISMGIGFFWMKKIIDIEI